MVAKASCSASWLQDSDRRRRAIDKGHEAITQPRLQKRLGFCSNPAKVSPDQVILMARFTEAEIGLIVELLQSGEPLPKALRWKIAFEDELADAPDGSALLHEKLKGLIGTDLKRMGLFDKIHMIAPSDFPILIVGENGTGKKLIARTIHETGLRGKGPFILVDCSSLSEAHAENQLLGHESGAFTGAVTGQEGLIEMAAHGTVVFNDIDALPIKAQAVLLRFLENKCIGRLGSNQQKSVDARVIATSHQDLKAAVIAGRFRDDLYFHVSVITLAIPPLRERRDDIPVLASFFHQKYAKLSMKGITGFSADALEALWYHKWPGNVTELENRIKGAVVTAGGQKIRPEDLGLGARMEKIQYAGTTLKDARAKLEKDLIERTLLINKNNITKTAWDLGISRPTLYELMEKVKIPKP
jgi:two-component system NtrC family response regulator